MTKEGWFYSSVAALFALALLVYVLGTVLLWTLGAVLLVLVIYGGCQVWGKAHRGLTEQRLRNADVESARARAKERRHIAELKQEEVKAAQARRHLIPEGYIGAQLVHPDQRAFYHVWPQPSTITYNGIDAPVVDALPAGPPQRAPIFALSERDMLAPQLVLGYNADGKPLLAVDKALRSGMIVLGRPGEGKTTIGRYWTALSLKYRFPVMVIDPHESILGELAPRFYTEQEGITAANMAADIAWVLDHRISLGEKYLHKFLLIIVDEWAYYQRTCPELVAALGRVILEGRKYRMCVQILGHGFPGDSLGGTPIRDAICSLYILGSSPAQARMAGLETSAETTALLSQVKLAGPGSAILSLMGMLPTFCSIPDTSEDDLARLLDGLIGQKAIQIPDFQALDPAEHTRVRQANGFPPSPERPVPHLEVLPGGRGKRSLVPEAERQEILALAAQDVSPAGIARAMHKANSYADVVRLVLAQEAQGTLEEGG